MDRKQLKDLAKQQIKGKIGILFVITLLVALLGVIGNVIPVIGSLIISSAMSIGMLMIYLALAEGKTPAVGDVFNGFNYFWPAFKVTFFTALFTMLWSLLFVIPGIIKMISYSQAMYIMAENKGNMPALEAIEQSKKMMEGHKMEYFMFVLSFIGWILLTVITCGIAIIWVGPFMNAAFTNYYNALKSND